MSAIIIIELKNTPKVPMFLSDMSNITRPKGFRQFSQNPAIFYNDQNVPQTTILSIIKMLKVSEHYSQSVKNIQYVQQLKKG